jgi:hypothetical protein
MKTPLSKINEITPEITLNKKIIYNKSENRLDSNIVTNSKNSTASSFTMNIQQVRNDKLFIDKLEELEANNKIPDDVYMNVDSWYDPKIRLNGDDGCKEDLLDRNLRNIPDDDLGNNDHGMFIELEKNLNFRHKEEFLKELIKMFNRYYDFSKQDFDIDEKQFEEERQEAKPGSSVPRDQISSLLTKGYSELRIQSTSFSLIYAEKDGPLSNECGECNLVGLKTNSDPYCISEENFKLEDHMVIDDDLKSSYPDIEANDNSKNRQNDIDVEYLNRNPLETNNNTTTNHITSRNSSPCENINSGWDDNNNSKMKEERPENKTCMKKIKKMQALIKQSYKLDTQLISTLTPDYQESTVEENSNTTSQIYKQTKNVSEVDYILKPLNINIKFNFPISNKRDEPLIEIIFNDQPFAIFENILENFRIADFQSINVKCKPFNIIIEDQPLETFFGSGPPHINIHQPMNLFAKGLEQK